MFLKIQHSIVKFNNFYIKDLEIKNNVIFNKKNNTIIKTINDISFDNDIYSILIEEDKTKTTADIYICINIINSEKYINSGIAIPSREMFFKLLNAYNISNGNSNNIKCKNFDTKSNKVKTIEIFPHYILSIGNYIYDIKHHKIFDSYKSINYSFKGGVILIETDLCILKLLDNNISKNNLFILNNSDINIYNNISDMINTSTEKNIIINSINLMDSYLMDYKNVFIPSSLIKKYYLLILKEYISKSKNINFTDSIDNMINDNLISNSDTTNKFFNIEWSSIYIINNVLESKKLIDIIKSMKSKEKWILLKNRDCIDNLIKPIIKILMPIYEIPENITEVEKNQIYYKNTREIPILKVSCDGDELMDLKKFIMNQNFYKFNLLQIKNNSKVKYNINNIEFKLEKETYELFKLCDKYNNLNIFYYFINPITETIKQQKKNKINSLKEYLDNLIIKEKLEEFKLKLSIHEKMDKDIILSIKKNLSEIYSEIEKIEEEIELEDKEIVTSNADLCPISYSKLNKDNRAITICNHQFDFNYIIESILNDERCPLCREELTYKQINISFDLKFNFFIKEINNIIEKTDEKIILVSKYENLLIFLKNIIDYKSVSIINGISSYKINKFNTCKNKKILYVLRKNFNYDLGYINSNSYIFCESIWDDELDRYFLIRDYKKNNNININILIPKI
jgi:hypothetical protein